MRRPGLPLGLGRACVGLGLLGVGLFLGLAAARAQGGGQAQVVSPPRDQPVWGTVDIVGTATHPNFARYDVAILDAHDFTKEWRWLVQGRPTRAEVPMVLAPWNTTVFPDGEYVILIRIWDQGGGHQDFLFGPYRVANAQPTPTPTMVVEPTIPPEPTGTVVLTPSVEIELPPTATPGPSLNPGPGLRRTTRGPTLGWEDLVGAFFTGVRWTFMLFGAWGGVLLLRWGWRRLSCRRRPEP